MDARNAERRLGAWVFRNGIGLLGFVGAIGSLFVGLLLLALDLLAPATNPYMGILAYLVMPFVLAGCLLLVGAGLLIERRRIVRGADGPPPPLLVVDLARPHARRNLLLLAAGAGVGLLLASVVAYRSYHFSESSVFCGRACHTVMQPEYTTYLHSPHARISCAECHIGSGADWYVKAKLSGLYQVYSTIFHKYERPIRTPIRNLRPAQETCEQCHWPQKFAGNLEQTNPHFLADRSNTLYTVRLLLKVGGGDPTRGPVGGIHWHMNIDNRVEYVATDPQRQVIPWVRVTDRQGVVREYRTRGFQFDSARHTVRRMDCVDCHNRPSHVFRSPNDSVDLALSLGLLDPAMPNIKKTAVKLLTQSYATEKDALESIATALAEAYPEDPRHRNAIEAVQRIYRDNFFPVMKTNWRTHPNNLGHKDWPGCFRCHDGEHATADGKRKVKGSDCNACHVILAQGTGPQLQALSPQGKVFEHPGGDIGDTKCSECHTGGLQ